MSQYSMQSNDEFVPINYSSLRIVEVIKPQPYNLFFWTFEKMREEGKKKKEKGPTTFWWSCRLFENSYKSEKNLRASASSKTPLWSTSYSRHISWIRGSSSGPIFPLAWISVNKALWLVPILPVRRTRGRSSANENDSKAFSIVHWNKEMDFRIPQQVTTETNKKLRSLSFIEWHHIHLVGVLK